MPIYLLTPLDLNAPEWERSIRTEPVQVEGTNEQDARIQAEMHFGIAAKARRGKPTMFSPWGMPTLVNAELVEAVDSSILLIRLGDKPR
jgi:hypothetical protein